ncbi:hypothetical protein I312_102249 [Cryptococcus bacillisporus CA1280]|uniref:Unplaced genomic scaffold supercont1.4, whole genome shotgun sequence n=1 Tax=Cryptococcus bacillisporus CA1280 TaxID=1296109 RepID=A0A0D0TPX2_CRYGA|nr:hypothetical protein I312_01797 [Cryptococcus bacillisporus CA1280]
MGPRQGYGHSSYGLPARPSFDTPASAAGQSRQQGYPQLQQYIPQAQQGFYPGYGYGYQPNLSGGYPSGGFYPMYATPAPSFGQSLFRPPVAVNPEGYSYSTTYLSNQYSQQAPASNPPTKRQRPNISNIMTGGESSAKPWRNCSHPGCKFVGPGDQVEIHEEDRHLIYAPGKVPERSEEEERFAKRKGPLPPIQGTNITLNTPEDIEKWIAERKSRWPTAKRVQEKEEERQAAIARGEVPEKQRKGKGRRNDPASLAEEWGREVKDEEAGIPRVFERERGRGRGRGRGSMWGRSSRPGNEVRNDEVAPRQPILQPSIQSQPTRNSKINPTADSPTGLGGYDTPAESASVSGSSDTESSVESDSESDSSSNSSSSNSEDDQTKLKLADASTSSSATNATKPIAPAPSKPICKFFAQQGRCKFNDRCRFAHVGPDGSFVDISAQSEGQRPAPQQEKKKQPRQPPARKPNPFERPSMLGALLANPIQNTLSQISQTIRFLVANNMLQDVEIRPGQAEEEEKARNKVVLLDGSNDNEAIDKNPNMECVGDVVQQMKETVEGSEAIGEDKINVV